MEGIGIGIELRPCGIGIGIGRFQPVCESEPERVDSDLDSKFLVLITPLLIFNGHQLDNLEMHNVMYFHMKGNVQHLKGSRSLTLHTCKKLGIFQNSL